MHRMGGDMSIHPGQLREYVIRPVLRRLGLYSERKGVLDEIL